MPLPYFPCIKKIKVPTFIEQLRDKFEQTKYMSSITRVFWDNYPSEGYQSYLSKILIVDDIHRCLMIDKLSELQGLYKDNVLYMYNLVENVSEGYNELYLLSLIKTHKLSESALELCINHTRDALIYNDSIQQYYHNTRLNINEEADKRKINNFLSNKYPYGMTSHQDVSIFNLELD